jgi:hypothetical protein
MRVKYLKCRSCIYIVITLHCKLMTKCYMKWRMLGYAVLEPVIYTLERNSLYQKWHDIYIYISMRVYTSQSSICAVMGLFCFCTVLNVHFCFTSISFLHSVLLYCIIFCSDCIVTSDMVY